MELDYKVHQAHCCVHHGCKYSNEQCPVVIAIRKQYYPCEFCDAPDRESLYDLNTTELSDICVALLRQIEYYKGSNAAEYSEAVLDKVKRILDDKR